MLYVYIGRLDDPHFKFEGGDWSGNVPRRRFPKMGTPRWGGYDIFSKVANRIEKGIYIGDETDWGSYVAKVSTQQLRDFVAELYHDVKPGSLEARVHREANEFIDALDPGKEYALVASEDDTVAPICAFNSVLDLIELDRMIEEAPRRERERLNRELSSKQKA